MKLRNKKTGEVIDIENISFKYDGRDVYFDSLGIINLYWEDYKPAEPLIKDEKVRKAVKAWAYYNGVKEVLYITDGEGGSKLDAHTVTMSFYNEMTELKDWERYTIAELCGEEEE